MNTKQFFDEESLSSFPKTSKSNKKALILGFALFMMLGAALYFSQPAQTSALYVKKDLRFLYTLFYDPTDNVTGLVGNIKVWLHPQASHIYVKKLCMNDALGFQPSEVTLPMTALNDFYCFTLDREFNDVDNFFEFNATYGWFDGAAWYAHISYQPDGVFGVNQYDDTFDIEDISVKPKYKWSKDNLNYPEVVHPIIPEPQQVLVKDEILIHHNKFIVKYNFNKYSIDLFDELMTNDTRYQFVATDGVVITVFDNVKLNRADAYILEVGKRSISIVVNSQAGLNFALATLAQILIMAKQNTIYQQYIYDYPSFEYRGAHIDVARHFSTVDQMKRIIRILALYKFNKLHWHLTDDEGWRVEIRQFPELTDQGSVRGYYNLLPPMRGDGPDDYKHFYTQAEIREIVQHAANYGIEVIPEIDMPGHAYALVNALPQLWEGIYTDESYILWDEHLKRNKTKVNLLNPGVELTFEVVFKILDEIMELFPSKHIHIGGDEVNPKAWKNNTFIDQLMAARNLTLKQVEAYFVERLNNYLVSKGRLLAGWEEITYEPHQVNDSLAYMWIPNDWNETVKALQQGYKVINANAEFLYFDMLVTINSTLDDDPGFYWAGPRNLSKVYSYDLLTSVPTEYKDSLLGGEFLLWSELLANRERQEWMMFPRALAASEIFWTAKNRRNYESFVKRAQNHQLLLDQYDVNYRPYSRGW